MERYKVQTRFKEIGEGGQAKLAEGRVCIIGLGGLGGFLSELLTRAGVGRITLIDFDSVEISNLQRQILYNEDDANEGKLKVETALEKLSKINSEIDLVGYSLYLSPQNAEKFLLGHDLILDGTDNYGTRYLLNDIAVKHSIPWIFQAVAGAYGMASMIIPGETPCLKEILPEDISSQALHCSTVGVISPIIASTTAFTITQTLKFLTQGKENIDRGLALIDLWHPSFELIELNKNLQDPCPVCELRKFEYLEGDKFPKPSVKGSAC